VYQLVFDIFNIIIINIIDIAAITPLKVINFLDYSFNKKFKKYS